MKSFSAVTTMTTEQIERETRRRARQRRIARQSAVRQARHHRHRPSRPAQAGRSFAASITSACACRRTARRRSTSRRSARITPSRSIRCRPTASRSCGDPRRCAMARRRSAAWSASTTTAFRCLRRHLDFRDGSAARSPRSIAAAKARSPSTAAARTWRCISTPSRGARATIAFRAACRRIRA